MFRTFTIAAFLALTVTAAQADAFAPARQSINVSFSDLDLSHSGDVRILAGRIQAAAQAVCQKVSDAEDHSRQMSYVVEGEIRLCVSGTAAIAIAKLERKLGDALRPQSGDMLAAANH